jgi:hypothetical protein
MLFRFHINDDILLNLTHHTINGASYISRNLIYGTHNIRPNTFVKAMSSYVHDAGENCC